MSQVLAVGNIHTVTELLRDLRRAPRAGYQVIGVCVSQRRHRSRCRQRRAPEIDGVPVLGGLDDVADIVRRTRADTVAVTATAVLRPQRGAAS